ncbi:MAG: hypothetical protein P4L31_04445 [Candidatus Babeliales bacterium]|nr:hypothetical protein [Candidatus Babeliales bacterium]
MAPPIVALLERRLGFESHGMMLFALHDGKQTFITSALPVPNGTRVG